LRRKEKVCVLGAEAARRLFPGGSAVGRDVIALDSRWRVVGVLVVVFGGVLVAGGVAIWPVARRQVSDSLELSMGWFYGALPVGGALMILFSLPQLWRLARGR
jgi:hypothetical protein